MQINAIAAAQAAAAGELQSGDEAEDEAELEEDEEDAVIHTPIIDKETDDMKRTFMWTKEYQVDIENMSTGQKFGKPSLKSDFAIYTDGSLENGVAGGCFAFGHTRQNSEQERETKQCQNIFLVERKSMVDGFL